MVILDGNPYRDCYAFNVTLNDFIQHLAKVENFTGEPTGNWLCNGGICLGSTVAGSRLAPGATVGHEATCLLSQQCSANACSNTYVYIYVPYSEMPDAGYEVHILTACTLQTSLTGLSRRRASSFRS
jgi:hypothetical protein